MKIRKDHDQEPEAHPKPTNPQPRISIPRKRGLFAKREARVDHPPRAFNQNTRSIMRLSESGRCLTQAEWELEYGEKVDDINQMTEAPGLDQGEDNSFGMPKASEAQKYQTSESDENNGEKFKYPLKEIAL